MNTIFKVGDKVASKNPKNFGKDEVLGKVDRIKGDAIFIIWDHRQHKGPIRYLKKSVTLHDNLEGMNEDKIKKAALLWLDGKNTYDIAKVLRTDESEVANHMLSIHEAKRWLLTLGYKQKTRK